MRRELRLVAIAGPPYVEAESIVAACRAAEAGGVTAVQLRLKHEPASVILEVTRQLVDSLAIPVYVNDRADVALIGKARGVHVGTDDIPPSAVRTISPPEFRVGVSVGDSAEAEAALRARVDYWSIGPIYTTGSKADAGSPIGPAGFQKIASLAPNDMPRIAIGGIDRNNAAEIIGSGALGIAVISAVFGSPDIEQASRDLRRIVEAAISQQSA